MANHVLAHASSSLAQARPEVIAVWVLVFGLATGLALVAIAVAGDKMPDVDLDVARWVQGIDFFGWHESLDAVERLTGFPGGVIIWLGVALGFLAFGRRIEFGVMSVAPAIWLPKTIIKAIVASPRPTDDLITVTDFGGGFGFPSGHMTGGVAVLGMLAIIAVVRLGPGRARLVPPALVVALLTLASFNRVDVGAHWPSDVLGSLLLAGIWLSGLTAVYLGLRRSGTLAARSGPPI